MKAAKPKISIIVPIYNGEKYLRRCIESILNQTLKEFELILINDGSPDNCGKICDEYAEKDERIVVIHKKNAGCSAARNTGLEVAQGEYIGFADNDDWLEETMYEEMYSLITKDESDMVQCNYRQYNSDLTESIEVKGTEGYCFPAIWIKIFKRDIIEKNELRFLTNTQCGEDLFFVEKYMSLIDKISYLKKSLYNYHLNEGSTSINVSYRLGIYTTLNEIVKLKKKTIKESFDKRLENLILSHGFEYPIEHLRNKNNLDVNLEKFILTICFHVFKYWEYLSMKNKVYLFKVITKVYIEKRF